MRLYVLFDVTEGLVQDAEEPKMSFISDVAIMEIFKTIFHYFEQFPQFYFIDKHHFGRKDISISAKVASIPQP